MNKKLILISVITVSTTAIGLFLYNARHPIAADSLIGYVAVLAVAAVTALEYRLHGKRSLSRR
jgi:hypothetical protein